MHNVEPEDLIRYGLIPEFVGRLPVVATLEELNEEALVRILTEPKNAITKQYKRLFEMEGVDIEFRENAHYMRWRVKLWIEKREPGVCAPF